MTGFTIKLIAIIMMIIDHVGAYLQLSGNEIIPFQYSFFMRSIGRISLPIFAYFLVEGYIKTKNLKNYVDRLHFFALISQIPFSFLFSEKNYMFNGLTQNSLVFSYNLEYLIFIAFIIFSYWKYTCDEKFTLSLILISFAYLMIPLKVEYNGNVFLSGNNLNIMYELGASLILIKLMHTIEKFSENKEYKNLLLPTIIFLISFYFMGIVANYHYKAILLILFIFLLRNDNNRQIIFIILWSIFAYVGSLQLIIFTMSSALLIALYNKKRGISVKYLFYIIYSLHIVIISLFKIYI